MSVFEYLMVMTSIVLAVTLTQLLRGITEIWRSRRRYVPHLAWVVVLCLITGQIWWAFWDLNKIAEWTALRFGFVLTMPIVGYLASAVLLPQRIPQDADWRDHFFLRRREFMVLMTVFGFLGIIMSRVLLDLPFTHPYRMWQATMVALVLAGVFVSSERYHRWLPWLFLLSLIASQALFRSRPGAFAVT
jgi:hypothetical protein